MKYYWASIFLPILQARADYGAELNWVPCGTNTWCGNVEFCQGGNDVFGFRGVNTESCGSENPGPLIRMRPGNKYRLTLRNTSNQVTNLHTHGLHINGEGDSDNVVREVAGGMCLDYTYDIPADHPGGTYWYHPHRHGRTQAQVMGGAYGMLIVEDSDPTNNLGVWASKGNEKLLQIFDEPGGFLFGGDSLGNGFTNDIIEVEADAWYRLRVSVVSEANPIGTTFFGVLDLSFQGGNCEVLKVASDGIFHQAPFNTYGGNSGSNLNFGMTGASRADFAIKCASGSVTEVRWDGNEVANIVAGNFGTGTGMYGDVTDLGTAPVLPGALMGHATASINPANTKTISVAPNNINNLAWNKNVGLGDIAYDQYHEWRLTGVNTHPLHFHLYHVLVVTPGGCGVHKEGEFYDTIGDAGAGGDCTVRLYTADFGGRMVMHCHMLNHEDQGSMTWVNVTGPSLPQLPTDVPQHDCTAILGEGAPVTTTTSPSSSPTRRPSASPETSSPTSRPTSSPSLRPTASPTKIPTSSPTSRPTSSPSLRPSTPLTTVTSPPTASPTSRPTSSPSLRPTGSPTPAPTNEPTAPPVAAPDCPPCNVFNLFCLFIPECS